MASCFKLIVCAGREKDDRHQERLAATLNESTALNDKCRWSFRRKSSSQRVIIHTVLTTNTFSGDSDSMDSVSTYLPANQPIAPEKSSRKMHLTNEGINLSMNVDASENRVSNIANVEESTVTHIQTAVRRFWAQRELAKLKMLVKLQAAVRGHLVRQNAVGSLHCLRALVKVQALVRARYGHSKSFHCYISLDKLLNNSFARQLMRSTPNPKHPSIKCNPSSPCTAWSWMERWMSFASITMDGPVLEIEQEQKENEKGKPSHEKDRKVSESNETVGSPSKDGAISPNDTSTFYSKQEKQDSGFKNSGHAKTEDTMVKLNRTKSDARVESKTRKNLKHSSCSVKDSPRNLVISPGSHGTPASQLITNSGNTKNSESCKSKDSLSSVKKSYSSTTCDFSASNREQLQQNVDRRRISLDSDTSDMFELKRTDNSRSASLPSYMKATVSAKARLFASTSPRLSPDVLERDISLKKRHSLPVASVKQVSPKLRQPSSRNGTHSQDKKWQK